MKALVAFSLAASIALTVAGFEPSDARTELGMAQLDMALGTFQIDQGRYPTLSEGLLALAVRPSTIPSNRWHGPYSSGIIKDGWGRDFVYIVPASHSSSGFDLYSLGRDGVSRTGGNDPDDINNWDTSRKWVRHYRHAAQLRAFLPIAGGVAVVVLVTILTIWIRRPRRLFVVTGIPDEHV